MPVVRTWFEPCADCKCEEQCEKDRECAEGWDCERGGPFDFTRESEDHHNDPRRR